MQKQYHWFYRLFWLLGNYYDMLFKADIDGARQMVEYMKAHINDKTATVQINQQTIKTKTGQQLTAFAGLAVTIILLILSHWYLRNLF